MFQTELWCSIFASISKIRSGTLNTCPQMRPFVAFKRDNTAHAAVQCHLGSKAIHHLQRCWVWQGWKHCPQHIDAALRSGKIYDCIFLRKATQSDLKAFEDAMRKVVPNMMDKPGFIDTLRYDLTQRLTKHGLAWSLTGDQHMTKVSLDLMDYELLDK